MRATSLPTAIPVAAAALALVAAVLAPLAVPSAALAERWLRPVPGEVARAFDYDSRSPFTAGAHRGADLEAPPGARVRAACGGRVVHAGAIAGSEGVVSVRCGTRRVSYLPLAGLAVQAGERIRAGARIGTLAPGHGGLHLGVRREGDPFAYQDPAPLLAAPAAPFTAAPPPPRFARRPRAPRVRTPRPRTPRVRAPRSAPQRRAPRVRAPQLRTPRVRAPRAAPQPPARRAPQPPARRAPQPPARRAPQPPARRAPQPSPAPWPVWGGLAAVLAGAAGSGTVALRRRRLAAAAARAPLPMGR